jgi:hypothetical protein
MKFITPLMVSFSLFAFGAHAADDAKKGQSPSAAKPSMSQSSGAKAGASGSASAGGGSAKAKSGMSAQFDKLDTNKDGQLSRAEFDAMNRASAGASKSKSPSSGSSGKASGSTGASSGASSSSSGTAK